MYPFCDRMQSPPPPPPANGFLVVCHPGVGHIASTKSFRSPLCLEDRRTCAQPVLATPLIHAFLLMPSSFALPHVTTRSHSPMGLRGIAQEMGLTRGELRV